VAKKEKEKGNPGFAKKGGLGKGRRKEPQNISRSAYKDRSDQTYLKLKQKRGLENTKEGY